MNNVLNTGEIPNLFDPDELEALIKLLADAAAWYINGKHSGNVQHNDRCAIHHYNGAAGGSRVGGSRLTLAGQCDGI